MNCSSGLIWDSAINACHRSTITTSTTSSPSSTLATTRLNGTTAIGSLVQNFVSFHSYLPSGLVMRKQRFDSIHFDMRATFHWFPVRWRIEFKLSILNCLHGVLPSSLVESLSLPADNTNLGSHRSTTQPPPPVISWCHGHDK